MDLLSMKSYRFFNFQTFDITGFVFVKRGFQCAAVYIYIITQMGTDAQRYMHTCVSVHWATR